MAMTNNEIRKTVSDKIVQALEQGINPWRKPWVNGNGDPMPHNCTSGHQYRGVNVPYLWAVQQIAGYPSAQWLTFKQARDAGGCVRKGEKASWIVYAKPMTKTVDGPNGEEERHWWMLKTIPVFNVAQTDGVTLPESETNSDRIALEPGQIVASVDRYMDEAGARVLIGSDRACYVPRGDVIHLPKVEQFETEEGYAATALHELVHWTGHEDRCNRDMLNHYGSELYAKEELVAELGAAMLCAKFQISAVIENHASYIASWIKAIKDDDKAIFTAAKHAEAAMDWLDKATNNEQRAAA